MVHRSVIDRVEFLRSLSLAAREDLASRAITKRYARGQRLWTAGGDPRGLFIILEGQVRIVRARSRRQHVVHSEGPGATLGEVPLFSGGTYPATAIASDAVQCLVIDRGTLAAAIKAHSELAWALLERLANRVRHLLDRLASQTDDPVSVRLAAYLLTRPSRADGSISLGGTQEQLAEELGTAREVVVRLLRGLCEAGLIARRSRGCYAVLDAAGLGDEARSRDA